MWFQVFVKAFRIAAFRTAENHWKVAKDAFVSDLDFMLVHPDYPMKTQAFITKQKTVDVIDLIIGHLRGTTIAQIAPVTRAGKTIKRDGFAVERSVIAYLNTYHFKAQLDADRVDRYINALEACKVILEGGAGGAAAGGGGGAGAASSSSMAAAAAAPLPEGDPLQHLGAAADSSLDLSFDSDRSSVTDSLEKAIAMVDEMYAGEPFDSADDADLYAELDKVVSSPGSTPKQKEIAEELRQAKRKRDEEETEALEAARERGQLPGTPAAAGSDEAFAAALARHAVPPEAGGKKRQKIDRRFGDDDYLHSRFGELKF